MERKLRDELKCDRLLGIGAHADDVDFNAGGTVAALAAEGAEIYYLVLTDGGKGSADTGISTESLIRSRQAEQREAARILGVKDVFFLDYEDGALECDSDLKRDIVRYIRQVRPDVVTAFDPTLVYYTPEAFINHSDHRAAGQAVLDAAYPLARDHLSFPELYAEGLEPHKVATLLFTNFEKQDYFVDISQTIDQKMAAIAAHASQVHDLAYVQSRFTERAAQLGERTGSRYAEGFVRLDIRAL